MLKINLLGYVGLRILGMSMLNDKEQHKIRLLASENLIHYESVGLFTAKSSEDLFSFIKKLNDIYTILLL